MSRVLASLGLMLLVVASSATGMADDPKPAPSDPTPAAAPAGVGDPAEKLAEPSPAQKAIMAVAEAFTKAYNERDAKAIASLFVEDGEILLDQEDPVKGRKAIQAAFEETFADSPEATITLEDSTIRFLAPELAIEEGTATVSQPPSEDGTPGDTLRSHYTVHYLKKGDTWLQASVQDTPDRELTVEEHLAQIEWLVGDWVDEGQDGIVETQCDWDPSGKFLIRHFKAKLDGQDIMNGTERIGWDPLSKQIISWMFDSEGGHGEALWTRSGDEWIVKAKGVLPDGRIASATRIVTMVSKDMIRFRSTDRVAGGTAKPDIEEVVLVRKPPAPAVRAKANTEPGNAVEVQKAAAPK